MEKIEDGKEKIQSWKRKVQCEGGFWQDEIPCGDSFSVTENDLSVQSVNVMGECDMEVIGFKCPECGTFTELGIDDIPTVIRNRVLGKYYAKKKPVKAFKGWLHRIFG